MSITTNEREYLLRNIKELLTEYYYDYTDDALNLIIDEWSEQKAPLIEAFKRHPNYMEGKFMIAFRTSYDREIDCNAIYGFKNWIMAVAPSLREGLPEGMKQQIVEDRTVYLPRNLYLFLDGKLAYLTEKVIDVDTAELINSIVPEVHAHNGQKTSRVINKLLTYLGYNKHPDYNREYAKYADALSPMTIERHTVLSLNPLDYLTMSFGNSWASCHTIDKTNKRDMPNSYEGMYSSGTISYMLDPSSMVLYTVDDTYEGDEFWSQPKINRQMFHWGADKLVQGRLYPQDNDYCAGGYTPYRNIVQEIMSNIWDFPNLWTVSKGTNNARKYIVSEGTHYRDYCNYENCSLSRPKGSENEESFRVGAEPICIECGDRHDVRENINCCKENRYICENCGCVIDEDDAIEIDGYYYCRDCVEYCDRCGEYHRGDSYYIDGEDRYVCEYCYENYYTYCEDCNRTVNRYDVVWVDSVQQDVCQDCLDRYYTRCDKCGEWYPTDNLIEHEGKHYCDYCHEEINEESEEA